MPEPVSETKQTVPALIDPDTAMALVLQGKVKPIDATYHVPPSDRNAITEFEAAHLPGAVFFDIDRISATDTDLPHMLPTPEAFAAAMGALGIGDDDHVLAYDLHGVMSAARAWWMFRAFGHDRVSVLDGGLLAWQAAGFDVEHGPAHAVQPAHFTAQYRPELVASRESVATGDRQVLDFRAAGRFRGEDAEPRAGLQKGHIPGSRNVPWGSLIHPEAKRMLNVSDMQAQFVSQGAQPDAPAICSCGSGVTACVGALSLYLLGNENVAVYDGSWAEWGSGQWPVATGTH